MQDAREIYFLSRSVEKILYILHKSNGDFLDDNTKAYTSLLTSDKINRDTLVVFYNLLPDNTVVAVLIYLTNHRTHIPVTAESL